MIQVLNSFLLSEQSGQNPLTWDNENEILHTSFDCNTLNRQHRLNSLYIKYYLYSKYLITDTS